MGFRSWSSCCCVVWLFWDRCKDYVGLLNVDFNADFCIHANCSHGFILWSQNTRTIPTVKLKHYNRKKMTQVSEWYCKSVKTMKHRCDFVGLCHWFVCLCILCMLCKNKMWKQKNTKNVSALAARRSLITSYVGPVAPVLWHRCHAHFRYFWIFFSGKKKRSHSLLTLV